MTRKLFKYVFSESHYITLNNAVVSQITDSSTVCSVCLVVYKRKHKNLHYRPFVRGIHRWLVDSPLWGPVKWEAFPCADVILAPVPLSIFRSNSKFDENSKHYSVKLRGRSQRYFAHVTTVSLSWRVQNFVVIGRVYSKLEHSEFSSNFEFDRNMLSGTGAWSTTGLLGYWIC